MRVELMREIARRREAEDNANDLAESNGTLNAQLNELEQKIESLEGWDRLSDPSGDEGRAVTYRQAV